MTSIKNTAIEVQDPLLQSFGTIRSAKNICMILVLLCLLGELAVAVMVGFCSCGQSLTVTSMPAELKTSAMVGLLSACQVVAPAACLIAAIAMLLAAMLALQARVGGTGKYISGFFWAIVLLLVLVPWQQFMQGLTVMGVLPSFQQLIADTRDINPSVCNASTWQPCGLFYARYLAYPVFAILIWTVVMVKFAKGLRSTFPKPIEIEPIPVQ
jgi:hypothetical protein